MNHHSMSSTSQESSRTDAEFRQYAPQGRNYAMGMLGNSADADEVVQEAMLKILNGTESNELPLHFQPLFFATIRNLCIDIIRKRETSRLQSLDQTDELAVSIDPQQTDDSPQDNQTEILRKRLPKLLCEMPPQWSTALTLRIENAKTYAEIATDMNASHAQVRTWIFRARQFLRKKLMT